MKKRSLVAAANRGFMLLLGDRGSNLYLCKARCQREIETIDRQIDQLVYELYGLTGEEIKIVEEALRG